MKSRLVISFLLLLVFTPVFGQPLSDTTGLVNRLNVETGGYIFEVETVANFDIQEFEFNENTKQLTLYISSGLENNLGEVIIPQEFLGGNFTFYLNDQEYNPQLKSNNKISFITLNFTGSGDNKLEIIGTNYLQGLDDIPTNSTDTNSTNTNSTDIESNDQGGGCLIATATFDSEMSPQVQLLRELRDNKLLHTNSGAAFMNSFNTVYYTFSPTIADYERQNPIFKEIVKAVLTPMITSLSILTLVDMNSEESVLGYGTSLILLNLGMYFVAPAMIAIRLKSKINRTNNRDA